MKKVAALVTLLFWSISMIASASANTAVLCLEKSGKAAIEYSAGEHCDDATASLASHKQSADVSIHCTDCVDSPLAASVQFASTKSSDTGVSQLVAYVTAFLDTTFKDNSTLNRASWVSRDHAAMRSAYIGQRETIVIQQ